MKIQNPEYRLTIPSQNGKEYFVADPRVLRSLIALMDMSAVIGGAASHFGGPSALAEINGALHAYVYSQTDFDEKFQLINDAGHCENGLYALKALYETAGLTIKSLNGFRSFESPLTGHGEHHVFPEGVYLSNGPLGSSLAQAQGLAVGDRLNKNNRITVTTISDGACMEGEAKEALASIPGLAGKSLMNPFVLIISDNNTKLSGRIDEDSFSMEPTFESLENLGWKLIKNIDGHHLETCLNTFSQVFQNIDPKQPVALHFKTKKGKGIEKLEKAASGGHGFPLKDPKDLDAFLNEIWTGSEIPEELTKWKLELQSPKTKKPAFHFKSEKLKFINNLKHQKIQVGVDAALKNQKNAGAPIISVTSDLPGSTGVAGFRKAFPESCIDVGVAESNMVSLAAGLSKEGFIPVVDTFAQFGVTKGALPLYMASLSAAPMICIFSHTGFQDAADGASHQALGYFSAVAPIPNTQVFNLSSSSEAQFVLENIIDEFQEMKSQGKTPLTSILFLGRENFPSQLQVSPKFRYKQEHFLVESQSPKATVVASGSLALQAVRAADILSQKNIEIDVIHPSCLKPYSPDLTLKSLKKSNGVLISMEDHQEVGGFGGYLVNQILKEDAKLVQKYHNLSVQSRFGRSAYTAQELYESHGLDDLSLCDLIQKNL